MSRRWRFEYAEESGERTVEEIDSWATLQDAIHDADRLGITQMTLLRDGGPTLLWTFGERRAMIVYWDQPVGWEDAGFHAIDPTAGTVRSDRYRLSNGQVDMFPDRDTIPREAIIEIVRHAYENAQRYPGVTWRDDTRGVIETHPSSTE